MSSYTRREDDRLAIAVVSSGMRSWRAGEIAEHFDLTFGAISQHLGVLRQASLVDVRREGNRRMYRANQDALAPYRHALETMWSGLMQQLKTAAESEEPAG
jgi:DNA-binding transcriptional ArsR family regulator